MQIDILAYSDDFSGALGKRKRDEAITKSRLATMMEEVFAGIPHQGGIGGILRVRHYRDARDVFELYFRSSVGSGPYHDGGEYGAPAIAIFERADFERSTEREEPLRERIREFARRLLSGELEPAGRE